MADRTREYRPVVALFCVYVALVAVSAGALFVLKLGLAPSEIAEAFSGGALRRTRSLTGLLEVTVPHLLAIPVTLFTLVHLAAWLLKNDGARIRLVSTVTFVVAAVGILSGLGVRYLWPGLAVLKLVAFVGFEVLLLGWVWAVLRGFRPTAASGPATEA